MYGQNSFELVIWHLSGNLVWVDALLSPLLCHSHFLANDVFILIFDKDTCDKVVILNHL